MPDAKTSGSSKHPPRRAIVYIDGFNLFYGAIEGGPHRWLNLEKYFKTVRQSDDVVAIKYFTSLLAGPKRMRQETYLAALATLPLVTVIKGRYKAKDRTCGVSACTNAGQRRFTSLEEKRTDVGIAIHMLDDAHRDRCDVFVLVSGDSDLVPAVDMIRAGFPSKEVAVYVPNRRSAPGSSEIRQAAHRHKDLPLAVLRHCHFPDRVPDGRGGSIQKPWEW